MKFFNKFKFISFLIFCSIIYSFALSMSGRHWRRIQQPIRLSGKVLGMTNTLSGNIVFVLTDAGICHFIARQSDKFYTQVGEFDSSFRVSESTEIAEQVDINPELANSFGPGDKLCPYSCVAINEIGTRVALGGQRRVAFFDISLNYQPKCLGVFELDSMSGIVTCIASNACGSRFFIGCTNGHIFVYEIKSGAVFLSQIIGDQGQGHKISCLACNYDGSILAAGIEGKQKESILLGEVSEAQKYSSVRIYEFTGDESAKIIGRFDNELISKPIEKKLLNQVADITCRNFRGDQFSSVTDCGFVTIYEKNMKFGIYNISQDFQLPCEYGLVPTIVGDAVIVHDNGASIYIFDGQCSSCDLGKAYNLTSGPTCICCVSSDISGSIVFVGADYNEVGELIICKLH